jgi:putative transposase
VWSGHSCPLALVLFFDLLESENKIGDQNQKQNQDQNQDQNQEQRTGVSAPHGQTGQIECPAITDSGQWLRIESAVSLPVRNYDYRRRLPHYQKADRTIFVTFRKLNRDPFAANVRDVILQHCTHDDGKRYILHAAIVMPDHAHLLLTPIRDQDGWPYVLPAILKLIKGVSARSVNKLLGSSGPVWQDESFDHVLRSNESFVEKLEYIRQNPVRAGLVTKAEEYPWLWLEQVSCGADTPVRCL